MFPFLFQVDENYVGDPPKVEVTIENLNDNVDSGFLHNMVIKFGVYEELCIHFHPITR
jgi:histone-lysine N-methyltransferase SETD1